MNRRQFIVGLPLALSACSATESWAPDDIVSRAVYRDPDPAYLTLYTMKNTGSDNGAHTALLINASQRVIFDPAGSFEQTRMPERNDVLFGVTPELESYYVSYHARVTYYVVGQTVEVRPEVAEQALQLALANGPEPQAHCARSTSRILRQLPGFGNFRQTWDPNRVSEDFAHLPGVTTHEYRETDADDKSIAAAQINAALTADQ
ncbi:hypothetical protein DS901_10515 [Loktanella sp. D2R18]|uniref:hypothetical protein n=1 Tax=Rhodobacterales TaxID=204455 RepID=UPI000DEA1977|nr:MULTISPECIES: hypothetical protein [Rhodobacterales]MDO6590824.1 hypothetical protein [Yoonia sp. 1_MG-2023]RBW43255.1 hypothetical protein DS901_10515 [Loktanella sp. D2R18]